MGVPRAHGPRIPRLVGCLKFRDHIPGSCPVPRRGREVTTVKVGWHGGRCDPLQFLHFGVSALQVPSYDVVVYHSSARTDRVMAESLPPKVEGLLSPSRTEVTHPEKP
jgi:hypothetical protein